MALREERTIDIILCIGIVLVHLDFVPTYCVRQCVIFTHNTYGVMPRDIKHNDSRTAEKEIFRPSYVFIQV